MFTMKYWCFLKLFYFCVCVAFILFCLFNLKEKSFETSHFPQTWGYPIKLANRRKKNKKENHWRTSEICFWLYRCNQDMNDRFHCTPFQWHFECVISFGSGGSKLRYVWKIFMSRKRWHFPLNNLISLLVCITNTCFMATSKKMKCLYFPFPLPFLWKSRTWLQSTR